MFTRVKRKSLRDSIDGLGKRLQFTRRKRVNSQVASAIWAWDDDFDREEECESEGNASLQLPTWCRDTRSWSDVSDVRKHFSVQLGKQGAFIMLVV